LLEELVDLLNRPRIRRKYGLSGADIRTVVSLLLLRGEAVTPTSASPPAAIPRITSFWKWPWPVKLT
jgi:hypothetical protein